MRYGFIIDQNRCIGCHACTVACKAEQGIAIGVNRTWVKSIEKGSYPNTRRYFAVLRCNHCDNAPCIEICPTSALFRRSNGIIDFDHERCIGCKSCMQACPYDALYIDPDRNTAAKCNFDASRVEMGYKPACEIVCPTRAITSGDLDDPTSRISQRLAMEKVTVRKPEKGTRPKLFYVGVEGSLLQPTMSNPQSAYLWGEKLPGEDRYALSQENADQSTPGSGQEVYDVSHPTPWGGKIAVYLWAKSISAGVLLVSALLLYLGFEQDIPLLGIASPVIALIFLAFIFFLLIIDLKKPWRFYFIFTQPNLRSWLVIGSYILIIYGIFAVAWLWQGLSVGSVKIFLLWPTAGFAIASVGYSAFLFAQAKGRDFWQSPLLFWQLLVQAVTAGAATLILMSVLLSASPPLLVWLQALLLISLCLGFGLLVTEVFINYGGEEIKRVRMLISQGALRNQFWVIVIGLGFVMPLFLMLWFNGSSLISSVTSVLVLLGLWAYEDLWIKAGQSTPLS